MLALINEDKDLSICICLVPVTSEASLCIGIGLMACAGFMAPVNVEINISAGGCCWPLTGILLLSPGTLIYHNAAYFCCGGVCNQKIVLGASRWPALRTILSGHLVIFCK